ncbi:MAG: 50S ribosomal protein L10, partial [Veillonella sp.]|nr:50S ribosomal protein L10 [Veillonella sp.]
MAVTEQKKAIVAQMKETLSEAKGAVLIGYSG